MSRARLLRRYTRTLLRYARWRALWAFLLSIAAGVGEGIGLLALIPLLHAIGLGADGDAGGALSQITTEAFRVLGLPPTLPWVLAVFVALIALRALLARSRDFVIMDIGYGFTDHLRMRLYAAIGRANWLFLTRTRSSDFTHALTSDIGRVAVGTDSVLKLATVSVLMTAQVAVAVGLSPLSTLAALASGALLTLALRPRLTHAQRLGHALSQSGRELFGNVTEFLSGIKVAKSYTAEERHAALFERSMGDMRNQLLTFNRINVSARAVYQIGGGVTLSGLLYLAIEVIRLPASELLVLVVVFARLLPTVMSLQQSYQRTVHMLPAFEAVMAMQERCEAAAEDSPPPDAAAAAPGHLKRDIRLRGVRFSYSEETGHDVLAGVDLVVPAQRTVAIVGPSGAGKSTLADLLMGLLEPGGGTIEVDGVPLARAALRAWRHNVAYVPQETFLFHDTVRANLLWAQPEAAEDDLWRALHAAAAAEFVGALPQGLETVVGERGIRFSGGERQRLALARALLRRPALLILDEATSALDSESERRVQGAIEALHGRLTMVVIAHRLSTVRSADQIVVLDRGRIAEAGTWDQLLARPEGRFGALLRAADAGAPARPEAAA